jgi:pimeloyl-ACP methyl ester carboxylesterase
MSEPAPDLLVPSRDGAPIAVFRSGPPDGPPLILVHGALADHTTFRVVGPMLAERFAIHAIDRRGRGASGDHESYAIEREFEDVAAVADAIAADRGPADVAVFGHSYGGRCALGAALVTSSIAAVISYEGAPTPPGAAYGDDDLLVELRALEAAGDGEGLVTTFMRRVVGLDEAGLARYRADPVWPLRVAAAPSVIREMIAEPSRAAGLDRLGTVGVPVLQILGGDSRAEFGIATRALDERLARGRIVVIPGAQHAAHHSHPDAVVEAVTGFLVER